MPGDLAVVHVVVDREAVLGEEAEDGDHVLGEVRDRDDEQGAGDVHAPGVVSLQVRLLPRQVEPPVRELPQLPAVAVDHQLGRHVVGGRVDERACVTGREEVRPVSSVKKSSAVWKPAADGKVRPAAPPE